MTDGSIGKISRQVSEFKNPFSIMPKISNINKSYNINNYILNIFRYVIAKIF